MKEIKIIETKRIETGVIKFNDDWPGFFIRGDSAFAYRVALEALLKDPSDNFAKMQVQDLINLLRESYKKE